MKLKRLTLNLILCYLFWIIIITRPVFYITDISGYTITAGTSVILLLIAFILFNLQLLRSINIRHYWKQIDLYLVLYTIWIFITIFMPFSETTILEAVGNALLFLATLLTASITLSYNTGHYSGFESRNLILLSVIRFSSLIVVILTMVVYGFNIIDRSEIIGGLSPSVVGFFASITIIISLSFLKQSHGIINIIFNYLVIIFSMLYLALSLSKGSLVALALSVLITSIMFWKQLRIWHLSALALFAILISYFLMNFITDHYADYLFPRNPYAENLRTLTGRTDLWMFILDNYLNDIFRIIFGYGYHSFPEIFSDNTNFITGSGQAHNATIGIIFETGVIGFFFIMFSIGRAVNKIIGIWLNPQKSYEMNLLIFSLITIIVFLLIRGITEAGYGSALSVDHFLMALIIVMINRLPVNRLREPV